MLDRGLRPHSTCVSIFAVIAISLLSGCTSTPAPNTSAAPQITSVSATSFVVGTSGTFTVRMTGNPTPTLSESGAMPSNVTFNAATGVLSGTPQAGTAGSYPMTFTAQNGVTPNATQNFMLTVNQAPAITTQPTGATVNAGANASFTAAGSGTPAPTVQWQVNTNGGASFSNVSGATSATLSLTAVTSGMNGNQYQAVFTNSAGSVTSNAATLTVDFAPSITAQPTNQTGLVGANVSFTAGASANPAATVQWQVSTNGGGSFTPIGGATSATLQLTSVTLAMSGNQYEAVFTNSVGSQTTNAATLSVNQTPQITLNPTNQNTSAGGTAIFTAAATGSPSPTVQWQVSTDGVNFTNVSGATSTTLTLNSVTVLQNGNQYRAAFTNTSGTSNTTAATLTVTGPPQITQNPSNQSVQTGGNASFSAVAAGNPTPTVQWQVSTDGGNTFNSVSGATSTTLTLNSVTTGMNNNEYEAVFTNINGNATTTAATLTVTTSSPASCTGAPSGSESLVTGHWAALMQGWQGSNAGSPVAFLLALSTDGSGNLTNLSGGISGDLDEQLGANGSTSYQHLSIEQAGSSYVIGQDSTGSGYIGCMTLVTSASTTVHFRFSLGGINGGHASKGRIIEWDDTTGTGVRATGVMLPQDSTKFSLGSLATSYAFGLSGLDTNGGPFAEAGGLVLNTTTGAINFEFDVDDAGNGGLVTGGTGTLSAISNLTGRTTFASSITINATVQNTNNVIDVVNNNEFFILTADPYSANPILSGRGIVTTHGNFTAISGNYMIHMSGMNTVSGNGGCTQNSVQVNCADVNFVAISATATGAQTASITGYSWEYSQGRTVSPNTISGITATTDVTFGRVSISGANANQAPVFYLATPQANTEPFVGFGAGSGTAGNIDPNGLSGFIEAGATTNLTTASMAGNYFIGTDDPGDNTVGSEAGVVTIDTSGNVTGTDLKSGNNGLQSQGLGSGAAVTVTNADPTNGSDTFPGLANTGAGSFGITNGTRLIFFDTGSNYGSAGTSNAKITVVDKQ